MLISSELSIDSFFVVWYPSWTSRVCAAKVQLEGLNFIEVSFQFTFDRLFRLLGELDVNWKQKPGRDNITDIIMITSHKIVCDYTTDGIDVWLHIAYIAYPSLHSLGYYSTLGSRAAELKDFNWGMQIDWWLQPRAVFGHTFSGIIWHMPRK